jgi:hypothetical protein
MLEYSVPGIFLTYRRGDYIKGFNIPIKVNPAGQPTMWLSSSDQWKQLQPRQWKGTTIEVDRNFYAGCRAVRP